MGDISTHEGQGNYIFKWVVFTLVSKDFPTIIQLTALLFGYSQQKLNESQPGSPTHPDTAQNLEEFQSDRQMSAFTSYFDSLDPDLFPHNSSRLGSPNIGSVPRIISVTAIEEKFL